MLIAMQTYLPKPSSEASTPVILHTSKGAGNIPTIRKSKQPTSAGMAEEHLQVTASSVHTQSETTVAAEMARIARRKSVSVDNKQHYVMKYTLLYTWLIPSRSVTQSSRPGLAPLRAT